MSPEAQEARLSPEVGLSPEELETIVSPEAQEERESPEGQEARVSLVAQPQEARVSEEQEARVYTGERQCATYCCCSWQVNLIPEYSGPIPPPRPDFESTEYTFGIWL